MRVLTLNTWQERGPWRERWEVIFEGIAVLRPDIICFQEVFSESWAQSLTEKTGLRSAAYTAGDGGLVILSRWPLDAAAKVKYPTQSPTEGYDRFFLYAETGPPERRVGIINTHLSWKPDEGRVREGQIADLLDYLSDKNAAKERMLMGDLNAVPGSPEIRRLVREGRLVDTFAARHPGEDGWTWDNRNPYAADAVRLDGAPELPDRRLDYLFIPEGSALSGSLAEVEIVFRDPDERGVRASDHYGLFVRFGSS